MNDLDDIAALLRSAPQAEPAPGSAEAVMSAVRDELAEERRLAALIRNAPAVEPSAALRRRVMGAVTAERARERRTSLACRVAAAAAGAAAVAAVAMVAMDRGVVGTCAARDVVLGQIVDQQDVDGAWTPSRSGGDDSFKPALTAVSALALMKRDFSGCGAEVDRAVNALVNMQNPDGSFGSASSIYNHAFASYAILEYKRRGGGVDVTDAVAKAVGYAVSTQNHDGSWGYSRNAGGDSALTVWEAGVLVNARTAGWGDDNGNLRRALSWIRKGGCDFDYRQAIDRENSPDDGAIALTALATAAIEDAAKAFPAMGDVLDQSRLALRGAYSRSGMKAAGGLCRAAMSVMAAD